MKKILSIFALAAVLCISCDKEKTANGDNNEQGHSGDGDEIVQVSKIEVPEEVAVTVGVEDVIPVKLTPSGLSIPSSIEVTGGNSEIFTWELVKDGIKVNPLKKGEATLDISAVDGPATASVKVKVGNPVALLSVGITDALAKPFKDGEDCLTLGETYQFEAKAYDEDGKQLPCLVKWNVEGEGLEGLDTNERIAEVKVTKTGQYIKVTASATSNPSIVSGTLSIRTFAPATGVTFSKNNFVLQKDATTQVVVSVTPSDALQKITYKKSDTGFSVTQYMTTLTLKGETAYQNPYTVTVAPATATDKTSALKFTVYDYVEEHIKPGDWVFYNQNSKTYRFQDCGRRYQNVAYQPTKNPDPASGDIILGVCAAILDEAPRSTSSYGLKGVDGKHILVVSLKDEKTQWDATGSSVTTYSYTWVNDDPDVYGYIWTAKYDPNLTVMKTLSTKFNIVNFVGSTQFFLPNKSYYYHFSPQALKNSFHLENYSLASPWYDTVNNIPKSYWCLPDLNGKAQTLLVNSSFQITQHQNISKTAEHYLRPYIII